MAIDYLINPIMRIFQNRRDGRERTTEETLTLDQTIEHLKSVDAANTERGITLRQRVRFHNNFRVMEGITGKTIVAYLEDRYKDTQFKEVTTVLGEIEHTVYTGENEVHYFDIQSVTKTPEEEYGTIDMIEYTTKKRQTK